MELLKVENVEKYYGFRSMLTKAVDRVSFSVQPGEFVAIMGPSGSGKTTLLNCVATIDRVTSGHIWLDGKDITKLKGKALSSYRRDELGFIFQDYNLLDTLTGYENIALALSLQNRRYEEIRPCVMDAAKQLGIEDALNRFPYQMSGGEKQRIACARAIVTNPKLLLADEPTGALDSRSAKLLLDRIQELNESRGTTIMMVTHDSYTSSYASRVIFIKDGKIFHELSKGSGSRKDFFTRIIDVVSLLGGANDAAD